MKKNVILPVVIVVLVLAVWIGWYLLSPLFIDKVVDEAPPLGNTDSGENNARDNETVLMKTRVFEGAFVDADNFHKASGDAVVLMQDGETYLRLEDFMTTNGPDLKVYLSKDLEASEYISLGELKGNIGDQNYLVEGNVDFSEYDKVLIWCEQFSTLFGSAELGRA